MTRLHPSSLFFTALVTLFLLGVTMVRDGFGEARPSKTDDNTFSFAIEAEPNSLDPTKATGENEGQLVDNLFEGLVSYSSNAQGLRPGIAQRWRTSDSGKVYTFELRADAQWSDGRPVVANDFRRAWLRLLEPRNQRAQAHLLYVIQGAQEFAAGRISAEQVGIEALGVHRLRVTLTHAAPYFLELCALSALRPSAPGTPDSHFEPLGANELVTNGPFTVHQWSPGEQLILSVNPKYWAAERIRVRWIRVYPVSDNHEVLERYLAGQLDWTGTVALPASEQPRMEARSDYKREPLYGVYYLRLNTADDMLADSRVRQALNLGVRRDELARRLGGGMSSANRFVPPTQGYSGVSSPIGSKPDAARTLFPRGLLVDRRLTFLTNDQPNHIAIAKAIIQDWRAILGVEVELDVVPWRAYLARLRRGDYQIARSGWLGDYQDPITFLQLWHGQSPQNLTGWRDREYSGLLERASVIEPAVKRGEVLARAEEILLKRGPVVPLFFYARSSLLSPKVHGFRRGRLGHLALRFLAKDN